MFIIISAILLFSGVVQCEHEYEFRLRGNGWFKLHKVTATWKEAFFQCHNEGAVLASPLTDELLFEIIERMKVNSVSTPYFIGTHSTFSSGQFVSVEGVPLYKMPLTHMYDKLDSQAGECLSMNGYNISVVSCTERLPYICYKKAEDNMNVTICGTYDTEYRLDSATGSCYKVHRDLRNWPDAYALCIAEGGYLAIVNNQLEARIIKNMIPDVQLTFDWDRNWDPLYIGLRDWSQNGTWLSIHGDPLDRIYNTFEDGQPDGIGQYCGGMIRTGKLDNIWCHLASFFICEKDPQNIRFSPRDN